MKIIVRVTNWCNYLDHIVIVHVQRNKGKKRCVRTECEDKDEKQINNYRKSGRGDIKHIFLNNLFQSVRKRKKLMISTIDSDHRLSVIMKGREAITYNTWTIPKKRACDSTIHIDSSSRLKLT